MIQERRGRELNPDALAGEAFQASAIPLRDRGINLKKTN